MKLLRASAFYFNPLLLSMLCHTDHSYREQRAFFSSAALGLGSRFWVAVMPWGKEQMVVSLFGISMC